jgi:16S rRNA (cytosine1402-N4)-methyltransferase
MLMNTWDCDDRLLQVLEKPDDLVSGGGFHAPVMPEEVMAFLVPRVGGVYLDGTAGGGGHTRLLLEAGAEVVAMDQDDEALAHIGTTLGGNPRLRLARANFAEADAVLDGLGVGLLDGALLDLGVSSHQLDDSGRGFSFMRDGPLDMRMDRRGSMSAGVLLNTAAEEELARIFYELGGESRARVVAARIVEARRAAPLCTTLELAALVGRVVPRTGPRHPATKVFQALRMAVNDESGSLARGLEVISARLASGGRFAVLTFHSGEDRAVKHFFRDRSAEWMDRPEWPEPRRNPDRLFRLLTPRPIDASATETNTNPRARSAKLRVAEKL